MAVLLLRGYARLRFPAADAAAEPCIPRLRFPAWTLPVGDIVVATGAAVLVALGSPIINGSISVSTGAVGLAAYGGSTIAPIDVPDVADIETLRKMRVKASPRGNWRARKRFG
jgi:hypothetical protein